MIYLLVLTHWYQYGVVGYRGRQEKLGVAVVVIHQEDEGGGGVPLSSSVPGNAGMGHCQLAGAEVMVVGIVGGRLWTT